MSEFPNTCWTSVVNPAAGHSPASRTVAVGALNRLCELYWYPIYAYARAWGKGHHEAEDLTQAFFHELVANEWVGRADRSKTKFRTFLLTHFKYVLSNEYRMQQADKRGGQIEHLSFDFEDADERFQSLVAEGDDPTVAYDRAWAERVVEQTNALLRQEYERAEPSLPFDRLRSFLPGGAGLPTVTYTQLETEYGLSVDAIKQRVSRLNKRFRELLVSVVADTVSDPSQVDEELKSLVAALAA